MHSVERVREPTARRGHTRFLSGQRLVPRPSAVMVAACLLGLVLLAFIVVPLVALAASQSIGDLLHVASIPAVRQAILLSIEGALLATLFAALIGVPLAYALTHLAFPGKGILAAIIDMPLAVPHTVAGIALLFVFGRRGIFGAPANAWLGLQFWGTIAGVVIAMLFV
ncbi:MAG: hypothetical protein ACREFZ_08190, partial [Acetobacteraceae bacterium]